MVAWHSGIPIPCPWGHLQGLLCQPPLPGRFPSGVARSRELCARSCVCTQV